ncbi:MAG TPA: hypothetical protein VMB27_06285 [Solirubrobacteraceae bacterium]|nr:hypothetical protein [Solirubrobacteraceae bacterium]
MGDQTSRSARLRYTATGAVAALVAAGAIAGAVSLADAPPAAKGPGPATPPSGSAKPAPVSCTTTFDAAGKTAEQLRAAKQALANAKGALPATATGTSK